jgi:hypothetical protein
LTIFQSALKILKTCQIAENTGNIPCINLLFFNYGVVVAKLQFERLGSESLLMHAKRHAQALVFPGGAFKGHNSPLA